jgi:methyl-galactoside transport system substrate-binding protein
MKKALIFILVLFMFSLVSCGEDEYNVHLYIYDMKDPFMDDYANNVINSSNGLFNVTLFDAQNSQIIQNELIEEGLLEKPDLIIVNPVDCLGAYTIIEKIKEANIPIVFINREPLLSDLNKYNKAYYVGAKAIQSGVFQAEIIDDLFGSNPNDLNDFDLNDDNIIQTIIFKGEQGHQDAELRTEYVQSTLLDLGYQLEIISIQIADWNQTNAYQLSIPALELYGDQIELVISNNDAMALGVIEALIELGFMVDTDSDGSIDIDNDPWIPVIGIDGIAEGLEKIENGFLYATVINDSYAQAEAAVLLADSIIKNQDFTSDLYSLEDGKYIWIDYQKTVQE